jgi:HlyD family secretion protein
VGGLATRLGETRIESPLEGVVSQRRLDPGALVGPNYGSGAIVTVERIDAMRVFIPVNEREVGPLRVGQDAHVELDAFPG